MENNARNRRGFLQMSGLLVAGTALGGSGIMQAMPLEFKTRSEGNEEISLAEDLMREHGVLKRVLLVYDEVARRLSEGRTVSPDIVTGAAFIIQTFIEDYHEKLEEDFLFPRFERAKKHLDLVSTLRIQHQRGRILTDRIKHDDTITAIKGPDSRNRLIKYIRQFIRMYNPHEAREDTVLFPAFRTIVSSDEYDALGEEFEEKEHQMFGDDGFETYVEKVADLEKSLGIFDLSQFTPEVK
jgi:hemerythrin-like domain-containing protein